MNDPESTPAGGRSNVEIVEELYRRGTEGDHFPDELLADEIEYVNPSDAVEPGTRRGREEFHAAMRRFSDVYEASYRPSEFITVGDDVIVIVTLETTARGSGMERSQEQGHIWTLRNGMATSFRWFNNPAEALKEAGLEG